MSPQVYISYSREDYVDAQGNVLSDNVVSKVKNALEAAGITYWLDETGQYSNPGSFDKILETIQSSQIVVFLASVFSNTSSWNSKEIASAVELKKFVIPLRLDDTPYDSKIMFRICDQEYFEYYKDPAKGIADLVDAIQRHLEFIREAEKKKMGNSFKGLHYKNTEVLKQQGSDIGSFDTQPSHLGSFGPSESSKPVESSQPSQPVEPLKPLEPSEPSQPSTPPPPQVVEKTVIVEKSSSKKVHILYLILIGLLLAGGLFWVTTLLNDIDNYKDEKYDLSNELYLKESRLKEKDAAINAITDDNPFVITNVEVRNKGEQWGSTIYSYKTTYLQTRIAYYGLREGRCLFYVKFFTSDGELSTSDSSPDGYSYSQEINIEKSRGDLSYFEIVGWGGDSPGHWAKGLYGIEIWYEGKKVAEDVIRVR